MKKTELLAPVGSMESLYAAVENGANAVYLGGKLFNARHYASNFDNEEMKEAITYAHLRRVRVYVTVNILLSDREVEDALDYVKFLYDIGVDGIIVQDIGLASLVRKLLPEMHIHGSTQMTVNNLEGAKFLYDHGFTRVVLAREVPIDEIKYISKNTPIELEVFIHGALCVSYSGQCLMSSMIGGRSGNRGRCAQPCRMPSSIVNNQGDVVDGWEDKHILSPKDLNTLEDIMELVEAGVISLKIEGRMKRPEYVATVVSLYRKSLDLGYEAITDRDRQDIKQVFNRGFTKGPLFGEFGRDFISYDRPDNRGIRLGRVVNVNQDDLTIELEEDVSPGDGIEFSLGQGKYKGLRADKPGRAGDLYRIEKEGYVVNNSLVYKTSSMNLLERARESYKEDRFKRKIKMNIEIYQCEKPRLKVYYNDKEFLVVGDRQVEPSKKSPLTKERVEDQLSKLGDTIYQIEEISIDLGSDCFLPVSTINKMRRDSLDRLDEYILSSYRKETIEGGVFQENKEKLILKDLIKSESCGNLTVKVDNYRQFKMVDLNKVDKLIISYYEDLEKLELSLDALEGRDISTYIGTGKILYSKDFSILEGILDRVKDRIDGVAVSNLGTLYFVRENYDLEIHGDFGLNAFNSYSVNFLEDNGLTSLDLSPEMTLGQVEEVRRRTNIDLGVLTYGYLEVMTTKHCPMSLVKGCRDDSECKTCRYSSGYSIRDRIGAEFKMLRKSGYTSIYNPVAIMVLDILPRLTSMGINSPRIDFTLEDDVSEINKIQEIYYSTIKKETKKEDIEKFIRWFRGIRDITKGHFFRGIID